MSYSSSVFLNVPFDEEYKKLFEALVFSVHRCGCISRCALEVDDGSQNRWGKILKIIGECRLGIHDLSRTELDEVNRLPRFNMPLELGAFLAAKHFGKGVHARKACLILDREPHRYQKFCSDIAGQDIRTHGNDVSRAVTAVRDWLRTHVKHDVPGGAAIAKSYEVFGAALPTMCEQAELRPSELTFLDFRRLVDQWLKVT
jgi:hypothetical protein